MSPARAGRAIGCDRPAARKVRPALRNIPRNLAKPGGDVDRDAQPLNTRRIAFESLWISGERIVRRIALWPEAGLDKLPRSPKARRRPTHGSSVPRAAVRGLRSGRARAAACHRPAAAQHLKALIEHSREIRATEPIEPDQLQPASLDLRLGARVYRVRASFLPGASATVQDKIDALAMHQFELDDAGAVLEKGLRLHRAAAREPGAEEAHLGDRQPQELDRPDRRVHPPDHRPGHRVRPGARQLSRSAVRRDLAAHLQHPGAEGRPAEPDPDQARHAAALRRRHAPPERARRPGRAGARARRHQDRACRSPWTSRARGRARSSATGRASTPA